jgi:uncharacterized protein YraI
MSTLAWFARRRWFTRLGAVAPAAVVLSLSAATLASAASGTVHTAGAALTVRATPSSSAAAVASIASGTTVTIDCQTIGTSVTGRYGTTRIWDHVPAKGGYVTDSYVYTGSDSFVAPECGGTSTATCSATGITNPRGCSGAVTWAKAHLSTAYHAGYYGMCDHLVALAYGRSASGHVDANAHWTATPLRYRHSSRAVPAGGLAFFSGGAHGHVAISTGDGRLISNDIHGKGTYTYTTISEIENRWGDRYRGWTNPWF